MKLFMVLLFAAAGVGCGYSSHATTPAAPGAVPAIAQLVPPSTAAGSSTFTLEVDGTNFNSNAVVNFNGAAMATSSAGGTKVTATIPATAVMNTGTVQVTVTNPGVSGGIYGGGTAAETSSPMSFTIN